jgi:ATP-dependent helicase/nuclease subunit A
MPREGTLLRAAWPVAASQFERHAQTGETSTAPAVPTSQGKLLPFSVPRPGGGLALAASAGEVEEHFPMVHRLPLNFDPVARFTSPANRKLPYTPASALPRSPNFARPEGSFGVRAFGNVVHRFLHLVSGILATGETPAALLSSIPKWEIRLIAALRNEGLSPTAAQREAPRAMAALRNTLEDPIGLWILSSHESAASERSVATLGSSTLRADRTFVAGPRPLMNGNDRIWIIDFKTTEQGARLSERFEQEERLKYREQLQRYADVLRELSSVPHNIIVGLYYPLIPRLLNWTDEGTSPP